MSICQEEPHINAADTSTATFQALFADGRPAPEATRKNESWRERIILLFVCAGLAAGSVYFGDNWLSWLAQQSNLLLSVLGITCLLAAIVVGVFRQFFNCLLANAVPALMYDDGGKERVSYVGLVPPQYWRSPAYRVLTWMCVAILSLVAATAAAASLSDPQQLHVRTGLVGAIVGTVLLVRWTASRLLVAYFKKAADEAERQ